MRLTPSSASALVALLLAPLAALRAGELTLGAVFSDHMVLQRDKAVPVWGSADPNEQITVEFAGQKENTIAGADGKWLVKLNPMAASAESRTLLVRSGQQDRKVEVADVLVGDVWLAAGQSNMAMSVAKSGESAIAAREPLPSGIRFFGAGAWQRITTAEVPKQSAVAWAFAREIAQAQKTPMGMIVAAKGGTRIEAWMPRSALMRTVAGRSFAALAERPEVIAAAAEDDRAFVPYAQTKLYAWRMGRALPGASHAELIAPLGTLSLRGVLWYQGESNASRMEDATAYGEHLPLLVQSWRDQLEQPTLHVIVVQLPRYGQPDAEGGTGPWMQLRESQQQAVRTLADSTLVDAYDLGDPSDVHPRRKAELGQRLATAALRRVYKP
jgi:sialate O-acetylesterase